METKNKILTAFFDAKINNKAPKGLLLSKKSSNDLSYILRYVDDSILYEELLQESQEDEVVVAEKLSNWVAKLLSLNKLRLIDTNNNETRIASNDITWWVRNGFARHYMGFEKQ